MDLAAGQKCFEAHATNFGLDCALRYVAAKMPGDVVTIGGVGTILDDLNL